MRDPEIEREADAVFDSFSILRPAHVGEVTEGLEPPYPEITLWAFQDEVAGEDPPLDALFGAVASDLQTAGSAEAVVMLDHLGRLSTQHEALTRQVEHYGVMIWDQNLKASERMLRAWYEHARVSESVEAVGAKTKWFWSELKRGVPPSPGFVARLERWLCEHGGDAVLGRAVAQSVLHIQAEVYALAVQARRVDMKRWSVGWVLHALAQGEKGLPYLFEAQAAAHASGRRRGNPDWHPPAPEQIDKVRVFAAPLLAQPEYQARAGAKWSGLLKQEVAERFGFGETTAARRLEDAFPEGPPAPETLSTAAHASKPQSRSSDHYSKPE